MECLNGITGGQKLEIRPQDILTNQSGTGNLYNSLPAPWTEGSWRHEAISSIFQLGTCCQSLPVVAVLVGICYIRMLPARLCTWFLSHCKARIPAYHNQLPFHVNNSKPIPYIEDGYNMTLTDAPNDLGGRLRLNCARTTPELPRSNVSFWTAVYNPSTHTMWPGDLAPNYPDLWSSNFSLCPVNESDLLSEVETEALLARSHILLQQLDVLCSFSVIYTLNLDQTGARVGVALATLVAQMATSMSICQLQSKLAHSMPSIFPILARSS